MDTNSVVSIIVQAGSVGMMVLVLWQTIPKFIDAIVNQREAFLAAMKTQTEHHTQAIIQVSSEVKMMSERMSEQTQVLKTLVKHIEVETNRIEKQRAGNG